MRAGPITWVLLGLVWLAMLSAQAASEQRKPVTPPPTTTGEPTTSAPAAVEPPLLLTPGRAQASELLALQEQNKLIKQYQSSLLDTVYWALTLVGAVAALLVGGSWLVNFRMYESDKDRLREQFASKVNEIVAQADSKISSSRADIQSHVQGLLGSHADRQSTELLAIRSELAALQGELQSQLNVLSGRMTKDTGELRGELAAAIAKLADLGAVAQANVKETQDLARRMNDIPGKLDRLDKRVHSSEAETKLLAAYFWDSRNILMNALMARTQGLEYAVKAGEQWRTEFMIKGIIESLVKLSESGAPIDDWSRENVTDAIKEAAALVPEKAKEALEALSKIPVVTKTT